MNADSYYEPREASAEEVLEGAEWIADSLVAEWSEMGEWELSITARVNRSNEPEWEITRVAHDGDVHFGGSTTESVEFEDETEMREWLESRFPFPPEEEF